MAKAPTLQSSKPQKMSSINKLYQNAHKTPPPSGDMCISLACSESWFTPNPKDIFSRRRFPRFGLDHRLGEGKSKHRQTKSSQRPINSMEPNDNDKAIAAEVTDKQATN
jgi:hypothetical protein